MSPTSLANGEVPPQGVRELQAFKESSVLSVQACSSLTPWGGTSSFVKEVGQWKLILEMSCSGCTKKDHLMTTKGGHIDFLFLTPTTNNF